MTTDSVLNEPEQRTLLTYKEAARLMSMPIGTLYALVSHGQVPHIRLQKRIVRFDRKELGQWIDAGRVAVRTRQARAGEHV